MITPVRRPDQHAGPVGARCASSTRRRSSSGGCSSAERAAAAADLMSAGRRPATTSPSTRSSCGPSTPSTRAGRCWSPRPPARARRSWPSTPSPGAGRGRARPSTRPRSRRCRTRSTATSSRRHGAERVGLLTGDNSINGDAPVVVMTTEVLRNMIYAGSPALDGLRYVVLDEVHYLQDAYRGPVWEEVIIHLPPDVRPGVPVGHGVATPRSSPTGSPTVRGATDGGHRGAAAGRARSNLYLVGDKSTQRPAPAAHLRRRPPQPRGATASTTRPSTHAGCRRAAGGRGAACFTPRRVEVIERAPGRGDAAGDQLHLQPQGLRRSA